MIKTLYIKQAIDYALRHSKGETGVIQVCGYASEELAALVEAAEHSLNGDLALSSAKKSDICAGCKFPLMFCKC